MNANIQAGDQSGKNPREASAEARRAFILRQPQNVRDANSKLRRRPKTPHAILLESKLVARSWE